VYIQQGLYANIQTPVVLGSDGAGTCHGGREVIICPSFHWGENSRAQGAEYQILGMPQDGTFSDQICVPESHLFPKPEHLSWEEAAALPLAGLTAWRALFTKCDLQEGEKVLITGIGGGVALIAFQLALAKGAHVWVSSGSDEKIQSALDLGAQGGVNYKEETWHKTLKERAEGFDVIIDSAGGDGFAKLPALCNPGARIAIYGGTQGKISGLSPQIVFWKQISIHGTSMGTLEEFGKMLAFVDEHKIKPIVDHVMELEKVNEAMDRMDKGDQFGKIVLRLAGTPD
jgi:NADPH:quinone reductase-like Zn-dependent oxidoreductase